MPPRRAVFRLPVLLLLMFMIPTSGVEWEAFDQNDPRVAFSPPMGSLRTPVRSVLAEGSRVSELDFGGQVFKILPYYFADKDPTTDISELSDLVSLQLDEYLREVSYDQTFVSKVVTLSWELLDNSMADYAADPDVFVGDALNEAPRDTIEENDRVLIIHAGEDAAVSNSATDIHSFAYLGYEEFSTVDGMKTISVAVLSEFDPVGVFAHEVGHMMGLPDFYADPATEDPELVGFWELMALGSWNGSPPGTSPAHLSAWSRLYLGWMEEERVLTVGEEEAASVTLHALEGPSNGTQAIRIPITTDLYYLLEYRDGSGFDAGLPETGVLVYLVDEEDEFGYGTLSVSDASPGTGTLNDAAYGIGETFKDFENGILIFFSEGEDEDALRVDVYYRTGPDLAFVSLWSVPDKPVEGQNITFFAIIANLGTDSTRSFTIELEVDGAPSAATSTSLDMGEFVQVALTVDWRDLATPGTHTVTWAVDTTDRVDEFEEDNNTAVFLIGVETTLTIKTTLPLTQVSVNGTVYRTGADGLLELTLSPGVYVLEAASSTTVTPEEMGLFQEWVGLGTQPRVVITLTGSTIVTAAYRVQYLLAIEAPEGSVVKGGGWYDEGSEGMVEVDYSWDVVEGKSRENLVSVVIDGEVQRVPPRASGQYSFNVAMDSPHTISVRGVRQYFVKLVGGGDAVLRPESSTSDSWYEEGILLTVTTLTQFGEEDGRRTKVGAWRLGDEPFNTIPESKTEFTTPPIWVIEPTLVEFKTVTQYLLTLHSDFGTASGSGWYDSGSTVEIRVDEVVEEAPGTRMAFAGWTGDMSLRSPIEEVTISSPTTLQVLWRTQYLVTATTPYGEVEGGGWADEGSSISASVQTVVDQGNRTRRVFSSWSGDLTSTSPIIFVQDITRPVRILAEWKTQYQNTLIFRDSSKTTVIEPDILTLLLPNGTRYSGERFASLWLEKGTVVLESVAWKGIDVTPAAPASFEITSPGTREVESAIFTVTISVRDLLGSPVADSGITYTSANGTLGFTRSGVDGNVVLLLVARGPLSVSATNLGLSSQASADLQGDMVLTVTVPLSITLLEVVGGVVGAAAIIFFAIRRIRGRGGVVEEPPEKKEDETYV